MPLKDGRNPYPQESPAYQLFADMRTYELSAWRFQEEAETALRCAEHARLRADEFRRALQILDAAAGRAAP